MTEPSQAPWTPPVYPAQPHPQQAVAPSPPVQVGIPGAQSVDHVIQQVEQLQRAAPVIQQPYKRFVIPDSCVADSPRWHKDRPKSDLVFGLKEATAAELVSIEAMSQERKLATFIIMIGDQPVRDYTFALNWLNSLPLKAQTLVAVAWNRMTNPTEAEGELLLASGEWRGGVAG